MSSPTPKIQFDVERQAGRAPLLIVENGHDPVRWAEENREALRAAVDEHGAVLVRGLSLRDPAEVADTFQQSGSRRADAGPGGFRRQAALLGRRVLIPDVAR